MTVVFVSNFMSHHQRPLADALYRLTNGNYAFIATQPMDQERRDMGWSNADKAPYEISLADDRLKCEAWLERADIIIYGSAPYELIEPSLKAGKLVFRYSERPHKTGLPWYKYPLRLWQFTRLFNRYRNFYLLCASAYAARDYALTHTFFNKAYRWGYFTEVKAYPNVDDLIRNKKPISLLWSGRLLPLKHPEAALAVAVRLKNLGYPFTMNIVGEGELYEPLKAQIERENLTDCVHMRGFIPPEKLRILMEESEVFLFTSDRNEGWGAVLNESMNSACAVVASHAIGSVPFLIQDGENGLIYKDGDVQSLADKVQWLIDHPEQRVQLAKKAYETMETQWNSENAASRLLELSGWIQEGQCSEPLFKDGVCSAAPRLKDSWYMG